METIKGFILGVSRFSESSAIVSIFSETHGRFSGLARGAYRRGSPFAGALELFASCEFTVSMRKNREMQTLTGCIIVNYYSNIRADAGRIAAAETSIELIRRTVHDGEPLPSLYNLLTAFLDRLNKKVIYTPNWLIRMSWLFVLHFLKVMGFGPELKSCVRCGKSELKGLTAVSPLLGGVLCSRCGIGVDSVRWIQYEVLEQIVRLYASKADQLEEFPEIEKKMMDNLITDFLKVHFEKDFKLESLSMLYRL
jgi:DNA repair protein RecO (recombination protein O)